MKSLRIKNNIQNSLLLIIFSALIFSFGCTKSSKKESTTPKTASNKKEINSKKTEKETPFKVPDLSKGILDVNKVIETAKNVTNKKYPDANRVLVNEYESVFYHKDGKNEEFDEVFTKYLTEKGKREGRIISFHFNTQYSKIDIPLLEIIKPSGKRIKIDVKANSKIMVDRSQMSANIFDPHQKILGITIPGLQKGDMVHYIYHETAFLVVMPGTYSRAFFSETFFPVLSYTIEVNGPNSLPLKEIVIKSKSKGKISTTTTKKGSRTIHKWVISDVPQMFWEPQMKFSRVAQRLLVSTIDSWKTISTWYWNLSKPHLDAITPEITKKVHDLTANITDDMKKINAIFQFVSQQIRYMGITTETVAPGYEPHDVKITFNNKYGVCRDKAALLVSMLRIAGFDAYPVLIHAGNKIDFEVPSTRFNHAITAVELTKGNYLLMDSTSETARELFPAYLSNKSFLVIKPEGEILKTSSIIGVDKNMLSITTSGKIHKNGTLKANTTIAFKGFNDRIYRGFFSGQKPEQIKLFFSGNLKKLLPNAKLTSFSLFPQDIRDMSRPLLATISYTSKNFIVKGKGVTVITPYRFAKVFGFQNWAIHNISLKKRKYPLITYSTTGVEESIKLTFDKSIPEVAAIPKFKTINNKNLYWSQSYSQKGNVFSGVYIIKLQQVEFSPADYLQLKENFKEIESNLKRIPIYKKIAKEKAKKSSPVKADVKYLKQHVKYKIHSLTDWDEILEVQKKILTYSGKKKHSEITVNYNPVWEKVTVTASVKNPNGKISKLSKKEQNIMDASWVASAPRYQAGKTLVSSLPAVKVGSIINYKIIRNIKGKPFFSTLEGFKYRNPLSNKVVTVEIPNKLVKKFKFTKRNKTIQFSKKKKGGITTFSWSIKNAEASPSENQMPPSWSYLPTMAISGGNWKSFGKLLSKQLLSASSKQNKSIEKAKILIKGIKEPFKKIIAIRNFIEKNIRKSGPGLFEVPFNEISKSDLTLKEGYGNRTDIAVLYFSMLKAAGFSPELVLASSMPKLKKVFAFVNKYPQSFLFDRLLVKVKAGKKLFYLNEGDEYTYPGASNFESLPILNLSTGKISKVPYMNNGKNEHYTIELDQSGNAKIRRETKYFGTYAGYMKKYYSEIKPELKKRHIRTLVSGVSLKAKGVEPLKISYDKAVTTRTFSVKVDQYAVKDGKFIYFKLPKNVFKSGLNLKSEDRKLPYYRSRNSEKTLKYTIIVPKGYKIVMFPSSFKAKTPGKGMISLKTKKGSKTEITFNVSLRAAYLNLKGYKKLMKLSKRLSKPENNLIILEKK